MIDSVKKILDSTHDQMEKAISHLESELSKIRAGKANPAMLENIFVDYYGTRTPLSQVANVNTQDARTLVIQPWDKSMVEAISKAIMAANLGLNPQSDGAIVRINVPALTEERRKELVKQTKAEAENCKVSLRTIRRDANEAVKTLGKSGLPQDEAQEAETKIQQLVDQYGQKADKHVEQKEKEIMTI
jgi:ribosome recycling factor